MLKHFRRKAGVALLTGAMLCTTSVGTADASILSFLQGLTAAIQAFSEEVTEDPIQARFSLLSNVLGLIQLELIGDVETETPL